ncbi:uncharacterized protein N7483_000498 [Penicillium malachiteum]|uniref:uncharacterized protein n=1 Tax=Penicillium malachiteum TaxID=1324776 RepID=UPI002548D082|nr:uncharacterized protein N7483_000498 [Penicillium malachiteum]KAJ5735373.1 hypothetical protein N7483_000498 [Penicillium malachiteum]
MDSGFKPDPIPPLQHPDGVAWGDVYKLKASAAANIEDALQALPINGQAIHLDGDWASVNVTVRIKDHDQSAIGHHYFQQPWTKKNKFSISFSIVFHRDVNGNDLVWGNEFDHSIAKKLPRGFDIIARSVKKMVEPTMELDAYSDKPSIFCPALVSWSQLRIGREAPTVDQMLKGSTFVQEGADNERALELRNKMGMPESPEARKAHYRKESNRKDFWFFAGIQHSVDFGNSYLDMQELRLSLPGFNFPVYHLVDEETCELRFTLKNKVTGQVYLIVVLSLDPGARVDEFYRDRQQAVINRNVGMTEEVWMRQLMAGQ